MSTIQRLGKTSLIYFIGNVLSRSIGFFLLPIYTKYIIPEDFGYYDLSISYLSLFSSVIFFEIHNGVLRYVMKSNIFSDKRKFIYSGISIFFVSSLVYTAAFVTVNIFFDIKYLLLIYICGILENFLAILLSVSRGYGKNSVYAISGLIGAVVTGIFNVFFIVFLRWGYESLYYSLILNFIVQIIFLDSFLHLIVRFRKRYINWADVKILLAFALPLSFNSLAYWGLTGYNKIAIESQLGIEQNGIYAVASKFSLIINLFMSCFLMAWQEVAFSNKGKYDFYSKAINGYLLFVGCGVMIALPFISVIFPYFVDKSYFAAKDIIPLLIIGTMVSTVSGFLGSVYGAIEKTKIIIYTTALGGIINVALVHLFLNYWGLNGANLSFMFAFACCVAARIIILKKNIYIKLNWINIILIITGIIVTYLIYIKCSPLWNLIFFLLICLLLAVIFRKRLITLYSYARKRD